MYAIYDDIYHQYIPNVSIYTIHGSYGFMKYIYYNYGMVIDIWIIDNGNILAIVNH